MKESIIKDKSMCFAIRIVRCYKYLSHEKHEYTLSKQMLRCGTSIGANVKEALRGQSRSDFTAKMNISLKEASECEYWIELLKNTEFLSEDSAQSLLQDCRELIKILTSIVKAANDK